MSYFSSDFIDWLDSNAQKIDQESGEVADELLRRIAEEGAFKVSLPAEFGGDNSSKTAAVEVIGELAEHSLTASFIAWGQRTFIETLLLSGQTQLLDQWLPDLLTGHLSAGTGLSNAMKFLSDIEELNVTIVEENGKRYLKGRLPWVTNIRSDNFVVSFVAGYQDDSKQPIAVAVPSTALGLSRSKDLEFISLQGGNTAAITFDKVELVDDWILSEDARSFLVAIRPEFLGFQFGLALGLSKRSLDEVEKTLSSNRSVLQDEWVSTKTEYDRIQSELWEGLEDRQIFLDSPKSLFQLRIDIVDVVAKSLLLELQASGGRAYFKQSSSSFARRWNEAAFLPVVSPSAVQLRHILASA